MDHFRKTTQRISFGEPAFLRQPALSTGWTQNDPTAYLAPKRMVQGLPQAHLRIFAEYIKKKCFLF